MTTLKEDTLKQEKPCIFDHEDKLLLITRMQSDGTSYDYCQGCGWVDVKSLITKHEVEAKLEGQIQEAVIALANLPDVDSTEIWLQTRVFTLEQQLSELQKKGQS